MNHGMSEGLRKSLADLRENEERCRDAALAIQRVLEAEGALYLPAVVDAFHAEEQKVKALFAGPVAKPATAEPTAAAAARKPGPRTWPKVCTICGKPFEARSASAKCCSPDCVKEKNVRYSRAGYQAKAGKPAPKAASPKAAQVPTGYQKVCVVCGKPYTPTRKDQKCCSTVCGKRRHLEAKPAPKAPAPTAKQERDQAGGQTRIERIRMLAGADPIPDSVRAAAAEARDSENMG
jgi:hypothetical protein